MIPYMVGKLAPNSTHFTRDLVKQVPGRGYFCAVPSQNGDICVTSRAWAACYCSAAAKSRSACTELLFGPGLPTERVHTRFELKLPRYCSAAANSRFACTELLSSPGLPTDRARVRLALELPC